MSVKKQGSCMKIRRSIIICMLLSHTMTLFSGQGQSAPEPQNQNVTVETTGPATLNVHIEPVFNNENSNENNNENSTRNTNTNTTSAIAQATNRLYARISTRIEPYMQQLMQVSPSEYANSASAWTKLHKKQLIMGALGSAYCAISGTLIAGNQYINRSDLWASWKPHMTALEMQESPQHELQKSLHEEILKRYLSSAPNRLTCYLQFMKAVELEEKYIKRHLLRAQIVRRSRLMRIFPMNNEKIKRARVKQKRLAFVKHIFISWAAQQPSLKGGLVCE